MSDCRRAMIKADMQTIQDACRYFKIDIKRYPDNLNDLMEKPSGATTWQGPYLDRPPIDPWDNLYIYRRCSDGEPEIISLGADGEPGGTEEAQDLSSRTSYGDSD